MTSEADASVGAYGHTWHDGGQSLAPSAAMAGVHAAIAEPIQFAAIPFAREPFLKRPLDVALASVMLLGSALVWVMIALAIRLEDGGPVFYRQERWGRGGIPFRVLKFRTMTSESDASFGIRQATERDVRTTRTGRFLRACGLDELPQLLNIFRGEMSFVGPRALATSECDSGGKPLRYEAMPGFLERVSVRPGLTGLATIYLAKDAPAARKFRVDLLYVHRMSFWLDVRLIALSFWISFRGKWESRKGKV
jgi:lipopolysaccharide/colanic/teichoic acid biosynthesis glycosyltransferase